jgi:iron(II)-dependent oxidoreductase
MSSEDSRSERWDAKRQRIRQDLQYARERTLRLLELVPDSLLKTRVHDFYSPIGWHFGHIAMTEEYWALTRALGLPPSNPDYTFLFANIPENPKDNRVGLPDRDVIRTYMARTREHVLAALDEADLATDDPLAHAGYAWDFAHQHECQHQETIVELLQLLCKHSAEGVGEGASEPGVSPLDSFDPELVLGAVAPTAMVAIPGGTFRMGSDARGVYDNERRAHEVTVPPFRLDRFPVTAGQWVAFIQDGGYRRPELWTPEGWEWREREGAEHPEYWFRYGGGYGYYRAVGVSAILPNEPVTSVSWYEADAYARWIGKRLPMEAEWEYVASLDPAHRLRYSTPWGYGATSGRRREFFDCDLTQWAPVAVGWLGSRSALGVEDMAGKVWEWTASPFLPYPGFEAYPYDGYSKDHMDGNHYVCRGGSWATDPRLLRVTFRNWYVPTYRQGFLGLRCAARP